MSTNARRATALALGASLAAAAGGQQPLLTPGEASHYRRYTQHEEVARFLSELDALSPQLAVRVVGRSRGTGTVAAADLYLAVLTAGGAASPEALDRGKPTFLLFASQHGNEQSGKEAALALIRDLAVGELQPLLERLNVLVIPQVNPYGNRVDQRHNEQDLDLNRDHLKLEAPESEAVHRVFRAWMPEVTVDAHEKGDDYYRASFGCVSNPNVAPRLQTYSRQVLLAEVADELAERDIAYHEYLVRQPMGVESAAGAAIPEAAERGRETMLRYSTTDLNDGRNSLGIYQTLSFIFEGASRHDLETLGERTGWQRAAHRALLSAVARHAEEIVAMVGAARRELRQRARRVTAEDRVHLRMEYARSESEPTLAIRRFEPAEPGILGVLRQDRSAGAALDRDDLAPYPYPADVRLVDEVVENWFPAVLPTVSVVRPLGYIVPAEHRQVVDTLLRQGIEVEVFVRAAETPVETYRVTRVVPSALDYIAPSEIEVEARTQALPIAAGSFFVPTDQPAASLVPALLEPQSAYGLVRYWKYDLVPAAGELFSIYRWSGEGALPLVPYARWER